MQRSVEPSDPSETVDLVAKSRDGDKEAERLLFERYLSRLYRLANAKFPAGMERRFGADDVVQSVLLSLCRAIQSDRIELRRSGDLWAWLARINFNKLNGRLKHYLAARRSVHKEADATSESECDARLTSAFLSREPAIEELEEVLDEIDYLFGPNDSVMRKVVDLRLQDLSKSDIAERLRVSHTTVDRHLKQVGLVLQERLQTLAG
jgi:RNA polymerase sigma factor (sigma-70 family)